MRSTTAVPPARPPFTDSSYLAMTRFLLVSAAALAVLSAACENPNTPAPVVSVQLMPEERTLAVGETLTLEVVARDEDGEVPGNLAEITWSSDNTAVATVSTTGVVTGVAPGEVTIRAQLDDVAG